MKTFRDVANMMGMQADGHQALQMLGAGVMSERFQRASKGLGFKKSRQAVMDFFTQSTYGMMGQNRQKGIMYGIQGRVKGKGKGKGGIDWSQVMHDHVKYSLLENQQDDETELGGYAAGQFGSGA